MVRRTTERIPLPCILLHILQSPDADPYADPEVKDVVGSLPEFYCAYCSPIKRLTPSDAMKCIHREAPCWKPLDSICDR